MRLRAPERIDIPAFLKWFNDPEVTEFLDLEPPMGMEQEEAWFDSLSKSEEDIFSIDTLDGKLIGNVGLVNTDWVARKVLIGIVIGEKEYWGKGYGTDAMLTLLRYLFEELNMNRVFLGTDWANKRAISCYENCGFVIEGLLRQHRWKRGRYRDYLIMSILREDWDSRQLEHREP